MTPPDPTSFAPKDIMGLFEFAKYFADRIIGMNNGKIIFDKASNKLSKLDLNKIYK